MHLKMFQHHLISCAGANEGPALAKKTWFDLEAHQVIYYVRDEDMRFIKRTGPLSQRLTFEKSTILVDLGRYEITERKHLPYFLQLWPHFLILFSKWISTQLKN